MTPSGVPEFFNSMSDLSLVAPLIISCILAASCVCILALGVVEGWGAIKTHPSPEFKGAKREIYQDLQLYRENAFGFAELTRRLGQTLLDLEKLRPFGSDKHHEVEALLAEVRTFHGVQNQSETIAAKFDLDDG
jgi:hypothetical protein